MKTYKIDQIDADFLENHAEKMTESDLRYVCIHADKVILKAEETSRFENLVDDITTAFAMLGDYASGNYRQIPWRAVSAVVFSLLYFLNPLDLIPEAIPVVGVIDDAAVLGLCFRMIGFELDIYRMWKESLEKICLDWDAFAPAEESKLSNSPANATTSNCETPQYSPAPHMIPEKSGVAPAVTT